MDTHDTQRSERTRILEMVESGKVTPEEGERLLISLEQRSRTSQHCPYCAEEIPAQIAVCPECGSALGAHHPRQTAPRAQNGFYSLTGLGKFLVCYTFLVCGIVALSLLGRLSPTAVGPMLLAGLGIVAAVLICKGSQTGWVLGALWGGIQMLPVVVDGTVLNRQFFHVGILQTSNGSGIGFNLVGLVLLIMFVTAARRAGTQRQQGRQMP